MTEKRAHIAFISGLVLLEILLLGGLKRFGASNEDLVLVYLLLLIGGGLGVGQIVMHYHR
jgi:hypothetical protein